MNTKKLILAIVVGYVFLTAANFLVHGVLMTEQYDQLRQAEDTWRAQEQMERKMWIVLVANLLFVAAFGYIYTRGLEEKPWMGQGFRYGVCMSFVYAIPAPLEQYVLYRIPYKMALEWIVVGVVLTIALGIIVAGIYRKPAVT